MIGWIIETLLASTILMLLVLVLRAPVRRAFGPQLAYMLWLLPALRLAMPPLPGDWQLSRLLAPLTRSAAEAPGVVMGVMNPAVLPPAVNKAAVVEIDVVAAGHHVPAALVAPTTVAGGPSIVVLLIGLWVMGALAFLAYHWIAHRRFCRHLLSRARIDDCVAEGRVRVIETDAAHGPLAFGIFRKYVAFPRDFSERYDELERDLALAHELGHHVRGDLIANWAALIVLAIHWFNPVAWRAFRAFRADQEMACDALVLAGRARTLRHAYGRAIVKSAHGGAVSAACHLHTINEVKGRLRMLMNHRKLSARRFAAGLGGVGGLSLVALVLTASGNEAAAQIRKQVDVVIHKQEVPAPPAPAATPVPPAAPAVAAPAAPPAPVAPPAPTARDEAPAGKHHVEVFQQRADGKAIKKMILVRADGTRSEIEMPDMASIRANVPEVREGKCSAGTATVENRTEKGQHLMIICSDRIQAITVNATRMAAMQKEMGMRSALMSLQMARRSIEAQPNLTAEQRKEALAGIDEAMVELKQDAKDKDSD